LTATAAALSGLSQRAIEALAEALDVLAAQAGANVADFVTLNDEGWKLDLESASDDGLLHLVKKLYKEKDGSDGLELYSAQSASDKLMSLKTRLEKLEAEQQAGRPVANPGRRGVIICRDQADLERKMAKLKPSRDGGTIVFLPHNGREPLPDE